jgi:hypothetical protein
MKREDIEDIYSDEDILFADGFDEAIIGVVFVHNEKTSEKNTRVVYDTEECLGILMENDKMSYEEASEYFDFNVAGSYVGEYTPLYLET